MNFASNISDSQDVQFVSWSPPASHIRKPPAPPVFSSMQQVGHEQAQHPRLPMPSQLMPVLPTVPKATRKKGPVPKLYDGECCKSISACQNLPF